MESKNPAELFMGCLVRVMSRITSNLMGDNDSEGIELVEFTGVLMDTDELYITLGSIDGDGHLNPIIALKHTDIILIKSHDPSDIMDAPHGTSLN